MSNKQENERLNQIDDIRITVIVAELFKLARKQHRSKKDLERVDELETQFEWLINAERF